MLLNPEAWRGYYSANDSELSVTERARHEMTCERDAKDRAVKNSLSGGGKIYCTYDADGNMTDQEGDADSL